MNAIHHPLKLWMTILFILVTSVLVSAQTCYITKTGSKYHTEHCRYLKYSKYSTDLDTAIKYGYIACRVCKPTRQNLKRSSLKGGYTQPSLNPQYNCTTVQCSGITQKGRRCKNRTKDCSGRCHHHR